MPRRLKRLAEKLYGSTVSWEGWTFRILSSSRGLRWIELVPTPFNELERRLKARILPDDRANEPVLNQLHQYLRGESRFFDLSVDLCGTPFQQAIWNAIRAVAYATTTTYADIASGIGNPRATRAVGQAVGANPVPIVIPCHRVIGKDGNLTGYGGGLPLKERLLALERGSLGL